MIVDVMEWLFRLTGEEKYRDYDAWCYEDYCSTEKIRDTERVNHGGVVEFQFDNEEYNCSIQDISKSGILLSTETNIPSGTILNLSFVIPGYKKPIKVEGEVVRKIEANAHRERKAGLGVRFKDFKGDSQKRLEKYILKSQNDAPELVYYL